ncbi:MAG: hypothetical protein LKI24_11020 [Acidipropionibacterium sp.]|jgi:hypothetical protein|nr:hypothetical protein [Acidipropionibacterium sp.]
MTIRLESAGGVISILSGTQQIGPPRSCELWVAGGRLICDMEDLDAMPSAVIHDPGSAQLWLPHVYGDQINDAILDLLESAEATGVDARDIDKPWQPDELIGAVRRATVAQWLEHWWPSRTGVIPCLDASLLELELSALHWRHRLLFDERETADRLEPLVPQLAQRLALLDGHGAAADVIEDAVDAVCHLLDLDTQAFDAVADAQERLMLGEDAAPAALTWAGDGVVGNPIAQEELALTASIDEEADEDFEEDAGEDTDGVIRLTVDPLQVRPRTVGGDRRNVEVVVKNGVAEITVAGGDLFADSLDARVWGMHPLPGTHTRLVRTEPLASTTWGYQLDIPLSGAGADLDPRSVDVVDPSVLSGRRTQEEILRDRDFITELIARRITGEGPGADTSAVAPFLVEMGDMGMGADEGEWR